MEIREGFKQTEVGIIPQDWEIAEMSSLGRAIIGLTYSPSNVKTYGKLVHRSSNIQGNKLAYIDNVYVNLDVDEKLILRENDILICVRNGSRDLIGKSALINGKSIGETFGAFMAVFRTDFYAPFIYQMFISNIIQKQINESLGATINQITNKTINEFKLPLPPSKSEQTAIATALCDTDALITSLEKLIEKKRAIRKGAMQELLSGKKRLGGHKGSWVENPFPKMCWFQEGPGLRNWQFTNQGIKVINVTNLEDGYLNLNRTMRYISIEEFNKMYKHFEIDPDDIVIASSGNSYAKVAVVRGIDLPLVMNTSVIRFKPLKDLDYNFLLAFLKSNHFKDQIDLMITGGAQPNFGPFHLNKVIMKLPPSQDEQKEIGQILLDLELDIEKIEQKLSKYKLLKQGMMQELLTGKTRLV